MFVLACYCRRQPKQGNFYENVLTPNNFRLAGSQFCPYHLIPDEIKNFVMTWHRTILLDSFLDFILHKHALDSWVRRAQAASLVNQPALLVILDLTKASVWCIDLFDKRLYREQRRYFVIEDFLNVVVVSDDQSAAIWSHPIRWVWTPKRACQTLCRREPLQCFCDPCNCILPYFGENIGNLSRLSFS